MSNWKAKHRELDLCNVANRETAVALIDDYCSLRAAERNWIKGDTDLYLEGKLHDRDGTTVTATGEHKETASCTLAAKGEGIWNGGMFIDTGFPTAAGQSYRVSFEVGGEAEDFDKVEFILQNKQWDEARYEFASGLAKGDRVERTFDVTAENAGSIWISVQMGLCPGTVTVSHVRLVELDAYTHETVPNTIAYVAGIYGIALGE